MSVTLGTWLRDEMRSRDMSMREFARYLGLAHGTVETLLKYGEEETGYPSVASLIAISRALKVDLSTIVAMVEPDASGISTKARLLAIWIDKLPESERELVDTFIRGIRYKNGETGN